MTDLEKFLGIDSNTEGFWERSVILFGGPSSLSIFFPCNKEDIISSLNNGDTELLNVSCGGRKISQHTWDICVYGKKNKANPYKYVGNAFASYTMSRYGIEISTKEGVEILKTAAKMWVKE